MNRSKRFLASALVAGVALLGAACESETAGDGTGVEDTGTTDPLGDTGGDTMTEDTGTTDDGTGTGGGVGTSPTPTP